MASILLFDSGVGGLSIYQHLRQQLGEATIHYLADNARFPYGELEPQQLIDGCVDLIETFVARHHVLLVVIACNSASTLVLEALREKLSIPVVGVVPAIKPAARLSKNKVIGLLATPGTVQRHYTDALIATYADDCRVVRVGSSELVQLAEAKLTGVAPDTQRLQTIAAPFIEDEVDCVVLGCTHFPLLAAELQQAIGESVTLVDSGAAVAKQVVTQLKLHQLMPNNSNSGCFYFTGTQPATALMRHLIAEGFANTQPFAI